MNADRQHERGAALIMALMLVVVCGMLTTSMVHGTRLLTVDTIDERAALQALQAAEGGIEQARWRLREDRQFTGEVLQIGNAEVTIKVAAIAGALLRWTVTATARCQPRGANGLAWQRSVVADLACGEEFPVVQTWREGR